MSAPRRVVLLVQLPIPPPGPLEVRGNIPLAAGYLKVFARRKGLERDWDIQILPPALANALGDRGLVEEILARRPCLVGFTCSVWNVERALWVSEQLKRLQPEIQIVLGGPEVTPDNHWVLQHPAVDYAVIGEGEQTFAELLRALPKSGTGGWAGRLARPIAGLWVRGQQHPPPPRMPLKSLDAISSPYLEGILDAADEQTMFLETIRGCTFGCKFCYYPKGFGESRYVSPERIAANLRHAAERGAKEVVILDPTLNQRPDLADFLRLLARRNPGRQWTCFGELRAEGIDGHTARLLREAGFAEVEVGLQSLDRRAQQLMGRKVHREAFERGARAMLDAGIRVRVDLILGLPGDTPDSVRRNLEYLVRSKLYCEVQVFHLSVLPGTAFRHEASRLGLRYQARPPYYVLATPTLRVEDIAELMEEAQDTFGLEYDPAPPPRLRPLQTDASLARFAPIDLDAEAITLPPPARRAQAFTLMLQSRDLDANRHRGAALIRRLIDDNPYTSLEALLEPAGDPAALTERALETLLAACFPSTSYLDLYYSLHPNRLLAAKRLAVVVPLAERVRLGPSWIERVGRYATIAWRAHPTDAALPDDLAPHEELVR